MDPVPFSEREAVNGLRVRVNYPDAPAWSGYQGLHGMTGTIVPGRRLPWIDEQELPYEVLTVQLDECRAKCPCGWHAGDSAGLNNGFGDLRITAQDFTNRLIVTEDAGPDDHRFCPECDNELVPEQVIGQVSHIGVARLERHTNPKLDGWRERLPNPPLPVVAGKPSDGNAPYRASGEFVYFDEVSSRTFVVLNAGSPEEARDRIHQLLYSEGQRSTVLTEVGR